VCSGCCEREELTFSDEEIDAFLLKKLRRGTGCKESHDSPSTVSIPFLPRHTPHPLSPRSWRRFFIAQQLTKLVKPAPSWF
jgi:hypothetical protein